MDFSDIDRALDMRIIMSYGGNLPIAQFTKKFDYTFQSALHFGDGQLELSYFVPEELVSQRELSIFLAQAKARKEGDVYFVNYPLESQDIFNALGESLSSGKSAIVDGTLLRKGTYYQSLRFHSSDLPHFSDSILKYSGLLEDFNISFLGPSPGIETILRSVRETVELSSFSWRVEIPGKYLEKPPYSVLPDEWVSETRFLTRGESISELIRTVKPIEDPDSNGFHTVSSKDNLYEHSFRNLDPFMQTYFSSMYEARAVRFCRGLHFHDGVLDFSVVIPKVLSEVMLKALTRCHDEFPDWKLILTQSHDL